jgi:tRNA nucleotidyltransferase (CCA-adding enzyme)
MWRDVSDYVHSLGLDAYLVGGAVRDELLGRPHKDQHFVVPGVGYEQLRDALSSHGKVEPLEVAGQRVGLRLYPRDAEVRRLAPSGVEFAPPRTERSTGPGRHDFEIVASADVALEEDMRRRDFTINAIAKRLADGAIVDPFGGREDLERGVLRTVTPNSFREDPLRLVRGLRFVSELDLDPNDETLEQMRREAAGIRIVSGERVGGGLASDGLGELSRLLLGPQPAKALRLARDTGVLVELLPEFEPVLGFDQGTERQPYTLDEHIFRVVQEAANAGERLQVRLAALLHDLGKPFENGGRHAEIGADIATRILGRLRYPTRLRRHVVAIVRHHSFSLEDVDARFARRFLADRGRELALDLVVHKQADLRGKRPEPWEHEAAARLRELLEQEATRPHRLQDLAIDGSDLIALGFAPGPGLGRTLRVLLARVVDDPALNTREELLAEARRRL